MADRKSGYRCSQVYNVFYHFTLVFNNLGKEKFVDWFGYGASVSVAALDAFQKKKAIA